MNSNVLTVTEAVRRFSDCINRVAYRHESFILRKGNKPVAELRPVPTGRRLGDLPQLLRSVPHLPPADVGIYEKDVDGARTALVAETLRDPWDS